MNKTNKKANIVTAGITSVLLVFIGVLLLFRGSFLNRQPDYPLYALHDHWTVKKNGEVLDVTDLDSLRTGSVLKGETWEISRTLPEEQFPGAALYFRTLQAVIRVQVGEEEIFAYGADRYAAGKMLKRGLCVAVLPVDYPGRQLTITFIASEPLAFNGLAPVYFGNEVDLYRHFLQERRLPLFFGLFFLVYALFQLLWMPYLYLRNRATLRPLFSALNVLMFGLYILGFYHLIELFTELSIISTTLEYLSLYLIPCVMCAYLATMLRGRLATVYRQFAIVDVGMIIAIVLLHLLDISHITIYLPIFYIVSAIESTPYLILQRNGNAGVSRKSDTLERIGERLVYFGSLIFWLCAVLDAGLFIQAKYFGSGETLMGIPFFTVGSMFYAMALTAQYFLSGISHLRSDVTKKQLEDRAYTDPLTGLANRIRVEQEMGNLNMDDPFVLISMDLDGLKTVNDTYGHAEGDRLLTTFADALKKCFGENVLTGRMGGDEFLVILTGAECAVLMPKLNELEHALFDLNLEERNFRYSVSYGYASNRETHLGRRVRDIYMLADRRMYDMKRRRKQEQEVPDGAA